MTALAGVMGRHYALRGGADAAVAQAIFESVLPRNAGDELPQSPAGCLVAVADRHACPPPPQKKKKQGGEGKAWA
jgi:glycyl-tRNA synthetase